MRLVSAAIVAMCAAIIIQSDPAAAAKAPAPAFSPGTPLARMTLTRIAQQLPPGAQWAVRKEGPGCAPVESLTADGSLQPLELPIYAANFDKELARVGAPTSERKPTNLFGSSIEGREVVDYEVGALIRTLSIETCDMINKGYQSEFSKAKIQIEWQIYSMIEKKVVASFLTDGSAKNSGDGELTVKTLTEAFVASAHQLMELPDFQSLLLKVLEPAAKAGAGSDARIVLSPSHGPSPVIGEAVGAVVLVSLPDSFGSGVLISMDGYVLTNAHVVQDAKSVSLRWSDGIETPGEVVRVNKARDVALIKTDPRGREPLPLRMPPPQVGDAVIAIGSPVDKALQGTVTRGIVSAKRIVEGYSFIQSDVAVTHGNSGGPLLDERGMVVGLADLGIQPDGVPTGLNLFIPIRDALEFLAIDLVSPPATATARKAAASAQ